MLPQRYTQLFKQASTSMDEASILKHEDDIAWQTEAAKANSYLKQIKNLACDDLVNQEINGNQFDAIRRKWVIWKKRLNTVRDLEHIKVLW